MNRRDRGVGVHPRLKGHPLPLRPRRGSAALASVVVAACLALVPGARAAEPSTPPLPSVSPPETSLGEWTYEGTWTLVSRDSDIDLSAVDPPVGTTRPAVLSITCVDEQFPCFVSLVHDDGTGPLIDELRLLAPGRLQLVESEATNQCAGATRTRTVDVQHGMDQAVVRDVEVYVPRTCVEGDTTNWFWDTTMTFTGALTSYEPLIRPTPSGVAGASPDVGAGASPDAGGGAPPAGASPDSSQPPAGPAVPVEPAGGEPFASSIPTVAEVSTDPTVLLQSALLAALLVFLMPFPSQLFNSTLEAHEDRVRRRLRLDRVGARIGRVGSFWTSWPGAIVAVLVGALLYGFLDPTFGIGPGSLATFVGILVGIVLVTVAFALPVLAMHRRSGDRAWVKVVPISLLIAVGCVLVSRLTGFQPGYLYGLLIGVGFARALSETEEGHATAIGAALMLGSSAAAWLVLGALPEGTDFGLVVVRTALAALLVAGLEGVVFGLLPLRFLPGEVLYRWHRPLWAVLLLLGAFAFFHILINPASGYLSDTSRTPLVTVLALLVGFSLGSIAFWAWFRLRPDRPAQSI